MLFPHLNQDALLPKKGNESMNKYETVIKTGKRSCVKAMIMGATKLYAEANGWNAAKDPVLSSKGKAAQDLVRSGAFSSCAPAVVDAVAKLASTLTGEKITTAPVVTPKVVGTYPLLAALVVKGPRTNGHNYARNAKKCCVYIGGKKAMRFKGDVGNTLDYAAGAFGPASEEAIDAFLAKNNKG
jgi:hypothetical protein